MTITFFGRCMTEFLFHSFCLPLQRRVERCVSMESTGSFIIFFPPFLPLLQIHVSSTYVHVTSRYSLYLSQYVTGQILRFYFRMILRCASERGPQKLILRDKRYDKYLSPPEVESTTSLSQSPSFMVEMSTDTVAESLPPFRNFVRCEDLWYNDGSLVIVTESLAFRVHSSIMAVNCESFRDITKIPQSTEEGEWEGIPVIRLQDSPEGMELFLKAIYHVPYVHFRLLNPVS